MHGPYDEDDAAKDTDSSNSDVETAWHDARDAAEASGEISRGSGPGESHSGEATDSDDGDDD